MNEYVWLSDARQDTRLIMPVETDISIGNTEMAIRGEDLSSKGMHVPEDLCPKKIWLHDTKRKMRKMPDLFWAKGQWIVSERAADIISGFSLGEGALYPVREGVFQTDRETRLDGNYFCWTFGCVKDAFLPDMSKNLRKPAIPGLWWTLPGALHDGDIAVSSQSAIGPDVWIDKMLFKSLFLSKSLGDALSEAELDKPFRIVKSYIS
ncbi:hypothetical protein [Methylobacterium sp. ap11]|jgi:hypothetical protein|uniref:hypothetical protein n=1 Tax=Methylobacterium sp. ap11 TaxID=1761799 RepID=UPI001160DD3F|nr:hypothetical protein [Methylobacterium sp. ap11]